MNRPNILWVSFEDTSPLYRCYGDPVARTPNLDRLAREGCLYTNAYSTAGVCAPARSAIITGMYPVSVGSHHQRTSHQHPATPELPTPYEVVLPPCVKCFPEYLRAQGYYCCNNEKTDYQFAPPVTAWDDCSGSAHWRNRPNPGQPFFAVFNPTRTHESHMWEKEDEDLLYDPHEVPVPPYFPDTPKVRRSIARMYTHIEQSDRQLGELLQALADDGLSENTLVFHWSDHGPMPRGKRWLYDSGIRVPLIVKGAPGIEPGNRSSQMISTLDLGPTVLSLAGVQVPHHMQGRAFLGAQKQPEREAIYACRDRFDESYDQVRCVRDKRFKYIRNCQPELPRNIWIPYLNRHPIMQELWEGHMKGTLDVVQDAIFAPRPVEELYDTEADPHEIHNLADEPGARAGLDRLRRKLDEWLDEYDKFASMDEATMVRQWYPDGRQPQTAPVVFIPHHSDNPGIEPAQERLVLIQPARLQLHCATQGASLAYRLGDEAPGVWHLYTAPLHFPEGLTTLQAKAIRIGYEESRVSTLELMVQRGR